jgi:hypothetical protein
MPFNITALSIMAFGLMSIFIPFSILTFGIMTLDI